MIEQLLVGGGSGIQITSSVHESGVRGGLSLVVIIVSDVYCLNMTECV